MITHGVSHKARLFAAALGITVKDAADLREKLFEIARTTEAAFLGEVDIYGQRYIVDFDLTTITGTATVRSGWIILRGENNPRLTTYYVLKRRRDVKETN